MSFRLLLSVLLTIIPGMELRVGMPLAIFYAIENKFPIILVFWLIVIVNSLLVFFIFFFMDELHHIFMRIGIYRRVFNKYLEIIHSRIKRFEKRHAQIGFYALMLFVAAPFPPGTGAWSGSIIAWILGLDRKKSIMAIIAGVMISAAIMLFLLLGIFRLI